MQGVGSIVAMPHKTAETRCSVVPPSSTGVKAGTDEKSPSLPNPTEAKGAEGIPVCHLLLKISLVNQDTFLKRSSTSKITAVPLVVPSSSTGLRQ